jgi:hypothetical protein
LKVLWLDREALALLFAMPMIFILLMSFALEGVFEAGSKGHPIEILVVHQKGGRLADQAIADLKRMEGLILIETHEGIPLTPDKAEQLIGKGVYPLALLFPQGFTERILETSNDPQKGKATVYLVSDPAINLQLLTTVKGAVQGAIERPVLLARIPQRLKEMFGTLEGVEGQLGNVLGNTNISERERSGVDNASCHTDRSNGGDCQKGEPFALGRWKSKRNKRHTKKGYAAENRTEDPEIDGMFGKAKGQIKKQIKEKNAKNRENPGQHESKSLPGKLCFR